jgi:HTH-type transcriptional regulator / antitoxin HipB
MHGERRAKFPLGNILLVFPGFCAQYYRSVTFCMKYTSKQIGALVRAARKILGATQKDLAMTSGTGLRFIIDLEKGKPTCQLGKAMTVLQTLGIQMHLVLPRSRNFEEKG